MKGISLIFFTLGIFLSLFIFIYQNNNFEASLIFLISQALSSIILIIEQNGKIDLRDLRLIYLLIMILYTIFFPLLVFFELIRMPSELTQTVLLFGTSYMGFYVSFSLFPIKIPNIITKQTNTRFRFNPVILNTFFFLFFVYLMKQRSIPFINASKTLTRTEIFETHSQLWVILMMAINATSIYSIFYFHKLKKVTKIIFLTTTIIFIYLHAQMGNRKDFLAIIIAIFIIYLQKKNINFNLKFIVVSVLIFLSSFWISVMRTTNSDNLNESEKIELAITSNEFVYPMQTLMFTIRDDWDLRYGYTYTLLPIEIIIPRILYPNKPKGLGSELVSKTKGGGQGYAYTPTTEAYLNFGNIGPFLMFFIYGYIFSLIIKKTIISSPLLYVVFYSLVFEFMRGEFSSFVYQLLIMIIVIKFLDMLQIKNIN